MLPYAKIVFITGSYVDMEPILGDATIGVIIDCAFGHALSSQEQEEITYLLQYIMMQTTNFILQLPIIGRIPGFGYYTLQKKLKRCHELADLAIHRRLQGVSASPLED